MKASVTLSISVVTVTESTGSRSKTTLGSKSCSTRGSGWRRRAVATSSVHMPITLLDADGRRRQKNYVRRLRNSRREVFLVHPCGQLSAGPEPKLGQDVVDVRLDGAHRQEQLAGTLPLG